MYELRLLFISRVKFNFEMQYHKCKYRCLKTHVKIEFISIIFILKTCEVDNLMYIMYLIYKLSLTDMYQYNIN